MTDLEEHLEIDRQKVINSVKLHLPIEVTSYTLPRNMEAYFRGIEQVFLEACHQEHLKEYIDFCLGELLTNSKKANTKRVYFKEKNLDINDPADYAVGMEHFKEETTANIDHYLELQKKEGYYIKFSMQLKDNEIIIDIKNNALLTSFEEERIQHKLATAQKYENMDEVIANVIDQSEGAGLGIIIIVLMLQKVGLTKDCFKIFCTDTETVTRITLPCDMKISAGVEIVTYEFVNMQRKLPVLRENFEEVNKIIKSGFINRNKLLECLRKDITLTLLTLKYAMEKDKKCFSLPKALEILSDQELKYIFSDSNPSSEFIPASEDLKKKWEHAYRTAFFAYNIYKNKNLLGIGFDDEGIYLLGLLNNIGSILPHTASDEQKQYVVELTDQYEDSSEKIRDILKTGSSNNYLGSIYTKKLGLSKNVYTIMNSWNMVDNIPEEHKSAANILYLAEMMQYYSEGAVEYYQIDKNILEENNIQNEEQFKTILKQLNSRID